MTYDGLPPICGDKHVTIVTSGYPPRPGGSSVLMRNLLSHFNPDSYVIATAQNDHPTKIEGISPATVIPIMSTVRWSCRLDQTWRGMQQTAAKHRLIKILRNFRSQLLLGIYPDFHFLLAATEASQDTGIPMVAYLHDTIAESCAGTAFEARARRLQERVFAKSARILVMSEGMADLYRDKYKLSSTPIVHTYLEPIGAFQDDAPGLRQAFWSGGIYGINARSVSRVIQATDKINCPVHLATSVNRRELTTLGIESRNIHTSFYSRRQEYLDVLRQQGLLILALDWPDESSVHPDELATIFPTKTPEYLASGRPILVHCPAHYFLARFFRENRCGVVISERSVDMIADAAREILDQRTNNRELTGCAIAAARLFEGKSVASRFQRELRLACHS